MAKISNISAYPNISNIDAADYLIITDAENNLMTKTCTISVVANRYSLILVGTRLLLQDFKTQQAYLLQRSSTGVYT